MALQEILVYLALFDNSKRAFKRPAKLGGWTVLSCSEDRKLRQIFRNKQALRRSLLTCDVSNSDNMRTLLCSVMGNKGQNTHNTKSQNYVICLNEEGYTENTLTDLQLM